MSDDLQMEQVPDLTHVHRCTGCGTRTRRSRLNSADSHVGLYECPGCGQKGPLNVEIVEQALVND
jgi:predicted RNA-binding Zn-ribbon protein involved in translation (DUF1610 family)